MIATKSLICTNCGGAIVKYEQYERDGKKVHCQHCVNTASLIKSRKRQERMLEAMGLT